MLKSLLGFIFFTQSIICAAQFYKTEGRHIVDPSGNHIQLKGTNLGNWLVPEGYMFKFKNTNSPHRIHQAFSQLIGPEETADFWDSFTANYITYEDIRYLKSIGLNHVRLPFHYKMLTHEDYLGKDYHGYALLDSAIHWCKKENLGVVLDMHCAPGGQTGDNIDDSDGYPFLFIDKTSQQKMVNLWKEIAEHYKNETAVIGYGLMNEPIAHYFEEDKEKLNAVLEPLYKEITAVIREVDKNHIIFLSGAQWNTNFAVFNRPFDNNVVYEFHKYWMPTVVEEIQAYLDFSTKYNVPLYCGETGENDDEWVMNFRKLLDKHAVNWAFWPYKKMDNTKGIMNFNRPEGYTAIIDFVEGPRDSYNALRETHPGIDLSKQILQDYLEQCKLQNCFQNKGYSTSLGFRVAEILTKAD